MRNKRLALSVTAAIAAAMLSSCAAATTAPVITGAVVDLSGTDLSRPSALDGEWQFYWMRFVEPPVFASGQPPVPDALVPFPALWKDYPVPTVTAEGYGTWHLRIDGLEPGRRYGIKASSFFSAATIYANGTSVQSHGTVGRTEDTERPGWLSLVSPVEADADGRLHLVIHASNFADRDGGVRTSVLFGQLDGVVAAREKALSLELFAFGVIVAMGAYQIGFFLVRKVERASLWFGLLCLTLAVRIFCYDEFYLVSLLPWLPWRGLFVVGYLTFVAAVFLYALFIGAVIPHEFPRAAVVGAGAVSGVYALIVMLAPTRFTSGILVWFQLAAVLVGLVSAVSLVRAGIRGRREARFMGLGFAFMFTAMIHDILVSSGIINSVFVTQAGLLVFIFIVSMMLTQRFALAMNLIEAQADATARLNRSLERFVPGEFLGLLGHSSVEDIHLGEARELDMAVLFVDLRSFSRIAERSTPECTFSFINEYLARVGPAVRDCGGFIDSYMGDGFMALFPGGAGDAVRCALDVLARLGAYNQDRVARGDERIRVGIGLHAGTLMIGTIGEERRLDGTVISDAVNLASRLEGVAKEYGLSMAISQDALADLADPSSVRMRFIGRIRVKGKVKPVSVFEIYEGDADDLRQRKDLVRATFERAVEAWSERRHGDARVLFSQVLEVIPDDGPTLKYLDAMGTRGLV